VPRIILTVGLSKSVQTEAGEEIGKVIDSNREGSERREIASLQSWYYRDEKTLMLWEVEVFGQHRSADPTENFLLAVLWQHFEEELQKKFSDCEQIVTPGWEPKYSVEQWRKFLASQGLHPAHREYLQERCTKRFTLIGKALRGQIKTLLFLQLDITVKN